MSTHKKIDNKIAIVCPTYNAGINWEKWSRAVKGQKKSDFSVLIIDSGSSDDTVAISHDANFQTLTIPNEEFNHGATRNLGIQFYEKNGYKPNFIIFLTQDAIPANEHVIHNILHPFNDPKVAAVCGRQLPHEWADPIAKHSRLFNYKDVSHTNTKSQISTKGLKTAYMSNSFAAYRMSVFKELDGFPEGLIFGEDMFLAAKMILAGHKTYYEADAVVFHSHNYKLKEEFKRYFDIGVFHSSQPFLLENFGSVSGEGAKFAVSEFKYCFRYGGFFWGLNSIIRTGLKFIGYKLGLMHLILPAWFNEKMSMDRNYWKNE